jgi:hypothetical protein
MAVTRREDDGRSAAWRAADWVLRDRTTGRWVVAQAPNASLGIWLSATVTRRLAEPEGGVRTALVVVATVALAWWAVDELARGVNPWRRALGAVVLAGTLAAAVW